MIDNLLTEESNLKVLNISNTMENMTFHHHYHILYDLRTLMGPHKKVSFFTYAGDLLTQSSMGDKIQSDF